MKNFYKFLLIGLFLLLIGVYMYTQKYSDQTDSSITIQTDTIHTSDTIIIHDTLRIKEPVPYYVEVTRIDTIAQIDTLVVTVPIERRTYKSEEYKAIIEGYNPTLISLDLYNKNIYIYDTVLINRTRYKRPKWAITGGVGIGSTPEGVEPYIGISVGYVFWSR